MAGEKGLNEDSVNARLDEILRSPKFPGTSPAHAGAAPPRNRIHLQNADFEDHDEWWFEVDGERVGPISVRNTRALWEEGKLSPDSLCWHEGLPTWVALFRITELADALAPSLEPIRREPRTATKPIQPVRPPGAEADQVASAGPAPEARNRDWLTATQERVLSARARKVVEAAALAPPAPVGSPGLTKRRAVVGGALIAVTSMAIALVGARLLWPSAPPPQIAVAEVHSVAPAPVPPSISTPPQTAEPLTAVAVAAPPPSPAPPPPPTEKIAEAPQRTEAEPKRATPSKALTRKSTPKSTAATAAVTPTKQTKKAGGVDEAFARTFGSNADELQTSEIFEVIRAHKAEVDACVKAQKAADPETSGRLVMRWEVKLNGRVSNVSVGSNEFAKTPIAGCLKKKIRTWKFPKHQVKHAPIEVPFVF
ncbi:MAG: AgmX/PglI C-terminal domain-containing protein [Myxococcaceae bacterium]